MKWILPILVIVLLLSLASCPRKQSEKVVIRDTVTVVDTVRDTIPVPYREISIRRATVYLPALVTDSNKVGDSVPVIIPITQKEYKTNEYKAYISGYKPSLDSIETYIPTMTVYVREKTKLKRWGLGLQVGYGFASKSPGFYAGIGVTYNLFQW